MNKAPKITEFTKGLQANFYYSMFGYKFKGKQAANIFEKKACQMLELLIN